MVEIKDILVQIVKDVGNIYPTNVLNRARKPSYPFLTYNTLNLNTKVTEAGTHVVEDSNESLTIQPQLIFSINSYSDNDLEALEEIRRVYNYFKFNNYLEQHNVVVVDVSDITNRTINIVGGYEFRYGFDVWIRYVEKIDRTIENIEKWSVNNDRI